MLDRGILMLLVAVGIAIFIQQRSSVDVEDEDVMDFLAGREEQEQVAIELGDERIGRILQLHGEASAILTKYGNHEGHTGESDAPKTQCFTTLSAMRRVNEVRVMAEIGFNGGHSAATLLTTFPHAFLYEFDMCAHPYSNESISWIKQRFPGRVEIICGDSTKTLPQFIANQNGKVMLDFVHVDGGHFDDIPYLGRVAMWFFNLTCT
jgi:hypothetical protein